MVWVPWIATPAIALDTFVKQFVRSGAFFGIRPADLNAYLGGKRDLPAAHRETVRVRAAVFGMFARTVLQRVILPIECSQ